MELRTFRQGAPGEYVFYFDYVHIWGGVYKWLGMNTTIFFGKMLKFIYATLDLE